MALVVLVVGFVIISDRRERSRQAAEFTTASCRFDRTSDADDGPGRNHTPTPTYRVNPPAGGNHTPQAAPAGIYTDANLPSDGQIVHAMEHGYIVLWYRPDLDEQSLGRPARRGQRSTPRTSSWCPAPSLPTAGGGHRLARPRSCAARSRSTPSSGSSPPSSNKGPEKVPH